MQLNGATAGSGYDQLVVTGTAALGNATLNFSLGYAASFGDTFTITTTDKASVGDTVLVTGKLAADRDFGHGYTYALLIEDAKVVVEPGAGR